MAEEGAKPAHNDNREEACSHNLRDFYERYHLSHIFNLLSITYLFAMQIGLIIVHHNKTMTL